MNSSSQFRCQEPPALSGAEYAAGFNEIKAYSNNVTWSDADQPNVVWFWVDSTGTVTTAGRWNKIAQYVATNNDVAANARLFCLLNVALADAGISSWETKYHYNFWRPITAIREAANDGNPLTAADTNWVPFITNTPNFPSYGSAHSTFSAAAAAVLSNFFGSDSNVFTVQPYNALVAARTYTNFSDAAREAGVSRIWAGIHFPFDNTNALIGRYPGAIGLKTGTTPGAGTCLAALAEKDGVRVLMVLMRARDRWWGGDALLDRAFAADAP